MCITTPNNVYYKLLESEHKDTQTVEDSKENNFAFNIYCMLMLRLQNSMVSLHLSALEAITF